jgi:aerobic-type carbon monoxide dehydrogenase small subunit (CoxS/CutS family)
MSRLYHGINNHNRHIRKGKRCPYCTKGSKPVHESLLSLTDKQIEQEIDNIKNGNI